MNPQALGGTFDIVLSFGILYHLTHPLEALQLTKSMAREYILLDTEVYPSKEPVIRLRWERAKDIQTPPVQVLLRPVRDFESQPQSAAALCQTTTSGWRLERLG